MNVMMRQQQQQVVLRLPPTLRYFTTTTTTQNPSTTKKKKKKKKKQKQQSSISRTTTSPPIKATVSSSPSVTTTTNTTTSTSSESSSSSSTVPTKTNAATPSAARSSSPSRRRLRSKMNHNTTTNSTSTEPPRSMVVSESPSPLSSRHEASTTTTPPTKKLNWASLTALYSDQDDDNDNNNNSHEPNTVISSFDHLDHDRLSSQNSNDTASPFPPYTVEDNATSHNNNNNNSGTNQFDHDVHNLLMGMTGADDDDDEELFDVVVVPSSDETSPGSSNKPPAQRLLENAFTTTGGDDSTAHHSRGNNMVATAAVPSTETAMVAAESWLNAQAPSSSSLQPHATKPSADDPKNPHRLILHRNSSPSQLHKLVFAKTILSSLAEAAQCTPLGVMSPIEGVAKRVLDALWASEDAGRPDTDIYTQFLKCIDASNPIVAVEKAEAILEAMIREAKHKTNSHTLPKPNQSTYNALIQITAQVGGTTGRYPKFTNPDFDAFKPDRQSFLAILSSCTFPPKIELEKGGFDREFVLTCISSMHDMVAKEKKDLLIPDTDVYNAALPWSGGPLLWTQSRSYTRIIPWDDYASIFAKGVKERAHDDNLLVQQAKEIDSWLEWMATPSTSNDSMMIAPNVETYEATIQAWLRTGTRKGLDRAQELLRQLIEKSQVDPTLKPRLQTFHPILASLYHANMEESSQLIFDWITEWEKLSGDADAPLDARLVAMKLWTLLRQQRQLFLGRHNDPKVPSDERRAEMISNAQQCSKLVLDASATVERKAMLSLFDPQPLEVAFFTQATSAWEYITTVGLECKDPKMTYDALSEMITLLVGFENLVKACKPNRGVTFRGYLPMNAQLEHMVLQAQQFFVPIVAQLSQHHDANDRPEVLLLIEKMTRLIGEFDEIQDQILALSDKGKMDHAKRLLTLENSVLPDDHFRYQLKKENVLSISRHQFLWQVVKFLQQASKEKADISDVLRLCHLVKDIGSLRQRSHLLVEEVDKIIHRLCLMNDDKMTELTHTKKKEKNSGQKHVKVKVVSNNNNNNNNNNNSNKSAAPSLRSPTRRRHTTTKATKKTKMNGAM